MISAGNVSPLAGRSSTTKVVCVHYPEPHVIELQGQSDYGDMPSSRLIVEALSIGLPLDGCCGCLKIIGDNVAQS